MTAKADLAEIKAVQNLLLDPVNQIIRSRHHKTNLDNAHYLQ